MIVGILVGTFAVAPALKHAQRTKAPKSAPPAAAGPQAGTPPVSLAMASAYPGKMIQLGTLGTGFAEKVRRLSGGSIDIRFHEPHSLVPSPQIFEALATGRLDAAWASSAHFIAKDPAYAFFASVPFGPDAAEYSAWLYHGGGLDLMRELYAAHGIVAVPCGVTAPDAGGWFRKEIRTPADFKGLKMRIYGLGGRVMEKLGVVTQALSGGEIFNALESGTIDAAEYSMPAIDLNLGFFQAAKFYYLPGWHQQANILQVMFSEAKWAQLTEAQQDVIETVCDGNIRHGMAEGEALQPAALAEMKNKGVEIRRWPPSVLTAMEKAWTEVVAEESAANPNFKKVWESYAAFRAGYRLWRDIGYLR